MKYRVKSIRFGLAVQINFRQTFEVNMGDPRWKDTDIIWDTEKQVFFIKHKEETYLIPQSANVCYAVLGEQLGDKGVDSPQPKAVKRGRKVKSQGLKEHMERVGIN